jgi:hypothetical protein
MEIKARTSTQLYETLYTDSKDVIVVSSTAATAVQIAAPVPEIMDHRGIFTAKF